MKRRLKSELASQPLTGAELGSGAAPRKGG